MDKYNINVTLAIISNDIYNHKGVTFLVTDEEDLPIIAIDKLTDLEFEIYKLVKKVIGIRVRYGGKGWVTPSFDKFFFGDDNQFNIIYKIVLPEQFKVLTEGYKWVQMVQERHTPKMEKILPILLSAIKIL